MNAQTQISTHIGSAEHCRGCGGKGEHAEARNSWGDTAGVSVCRMCGGTGRQTVLIGDAYFVQSTIGPRLTDFDDYLFPVEASA